MLETSAFQNFHSGGLVSGRSDPSPLDTIRPKRNNVVKKEISMRNS